jgi:hypothetical protein
MTREFLVHLVSLRTSYSESLVSAVARTVWPDYDGADAKWTGYTPGNVTRLTTMVNSICAASRNNSPEGQESIARGRAA